MKSMTGFAACEKSFENAVVCAEVKSYNSRFLDISVNLPPYLSAFEPKARKLVSEKLARGKIDVYIRVKEKNAPMRIACNIAAAKEYARAIEQIAQAAACGAREAPLSLIIAQEGVLCAEYERDCGAYWSMIESALKTALDDLDRAREREGEALKADLLAMTDELDSYADTIQSYAPRMESIFKESFRARFEEIAQAQIDEQRLLQETAALLVKYTINEELVRLKAHLASLRAEITQSKTPGKKIDFICQELNREINTIGSKNQILEISQIVVNAKNALENVREQARNIE